MPLSYMLMTFIVDLKQHIYMCISMIFVNGNENENGEKRESNEFANEN